MKWIPQVKHKGIYHTVTGGELELGDNRNNPGPPLIFWLELFQIRIAGKGDAIIYSCKASGLLPETESAHPGALSRDGWPCPQAFRD